MSEDMVYEPPALVEVGDFRELTLDEGTWGWDRYSECWWLGC
ncbi:lasso RiPP family leader peptide-containing protein [Streptomyces sp. JW3]|jgi:hypothetical protein